MKKMGGGGPYNKMWWTVLILLKSNMALFLVSVMDMKHQWYIIFHVTDIQPVQEPFIRELEDWNIFRLVSKNLFPFTFSCFSSVQNSPPRHWQQALLNRQVKLRWHSDHQVLPRGIWISDPPACICLLCLESQAKITSAELTGQFFTCSRISRHLSA